MSIRLETSNGWSIYYSLILFVSQVVSRDEYNKHLQTFTTSYKYIKNRVDFSSFIVLLHDDWNHGGATTKMYSYDEYEVIVIYKVYHYFYVIFLPPIRHVK